MKKWIWIIASLVAIFSLQVCITFGLFETGVMATKKIDVARFNVKVNGTPVTAENSTYTMSTINYTTPEGVSDNTFAPGGDISFGLNVDLSEVDVSIRIDVDLSEVSIPSDKISMESIEAYFINDETNKITLTRTGIYKYSLALALDSFNKTSWTDADKILVIAVKYHWLEDYQNTTDDYDTIQNTLSFPIPVNLKFTQVLTNADLVLEEYVEAHSSAGESSESSSSSEENSSSESSS